MTNTSLDNQQVQIQLEQNSKKSLPTNKTQDSLPSCEDSNQHEDPPAIRQIIEKEEDNFQSNKLQLARLGVQPGALVTEEVAITVKDSERFNEVSGGYKYLWKSHTNALSFLRGATKIGISMIGILSLIILVFFSPPNLPFWAQLVARLSGLMLFLFTALKLTILLLQLTQFNYSYPKKAYRIKKLKKLSKKIAAHHRLSINIWIVYCILIFLGGLISSLLVKEKVWWVIAVAVSVIGGCLLFWMKISSKFIFKAKEDIITGGSYIYNSSAKKNKKVDNQIEFPTNKLNIGVGVPIAEIRGGQIQEINVPQVEQ